MKKSIVTIGLFSLVMILTSFTTSSTNEGGTRKIKTDSYISSDEGGTRKIKTDNFTSSDEGGTRKIKTDN